MTPRLIVSGIYCHHVCLLLCHIVLYNTHITKRKHTYLHTMSKTAVIHENTPFLAPNYDTHANISNGIVARTTYV